MTYLDNAATTPLSEVVKKVILDNLDEFWNVNSVYEPAIQLKVKVEEAREKIAELIGAKSADEIYFTSGASEANSWIMKYNTILSSNIEHHSMWPDYIVCVDNNGILNPEIVQCEITNIYDNDWIGDFNIVSCCYVNNELGTIQPIKGISKVAHDEHVLFHTDATQALPHIKVDVQDLGVDMLSASAHKFNGPKGVGFLYSKEGVLLYPMIHGGSQEKHLRGGTTNTVGILAMAAALEDTVKHLDEINERVEYLQKKLEGTLLNIPGIHSNITVPDSMRVPGIINLRVDGLKGTDIVAMASQFGVYISSGSACNEGSATPSHVLKAIGLTNEEALSSIRISIGRYNTEEEIDYVCDLFPKIINHLRKLS